MLLNKKNYNYFQLTNTPKRLSYDFNDFGLDSSFEHVLFFFFLLSNIPECQQYLKVWGKSEFPQNLKYW